MRVGDDNLFIIHIFLIPFNSIAYFDCFYFAHCELWAMKKKSQYQNKAHTNLRKFSAHLKTYAFWLVSTIDFFEFATDNIQGV